MDKSRQDPHPIQTASAQSGLGLVLLATLGLSFKGIFAKFAYADGISVSALLLLRFALAVPLFWAGTLAMRSPGSARMGWRDWRDCSITGVLFFCAAWCDFSALHLIEAGISRIILFTFPGVIMVINAIRERRPPAARQVLGFSVAYAGLLLLLAPDAAALSDTRVEGVLWAFGASITYGAFWVASQGVMARIGSARFTAASNTVTLVVFTLVMLPTLKTGDWSVSGSAAGWVVLIVALCTVLPFFLLFEGIRRSGTTEASVVTLTGPLMTMAAAWVLLGERLSVLQAFGFGVVIIGIAVSKGLLRVPGAWRRPSGQLSDSAPERG